MIKYRHKVRNKENNSFTENSKIAMNNLRVLQISTGKSVTLGGFHKTIYLHPIAPVLVFQDRG